MRPSSAMPAGSAAGAGTGFELTVAVNVPTTLSVKKTRMPPDVRTSSSDHWMSSALPTKGPIEVSMSHVPSAGFEGPS